MYLNFGLIPIETSCIYSFKQSICISLVLVTIKILINQSGIFNFLLTYENQSKPLTGHLQVHMLSEAYVCDADVMSMMS